jgi:hypothetical protein
VAGPRCGNLLLEVAALERENPDLGSTPDRGRDSRLTAGIHGAAGVVVDDQHAVEVDPVIVALRLEAQASRCGAEVGACRRQHREVEGP